MTEKLCYEGLDSARTSLSNRLDEFRSIATCRAFKAYRYRLLAILASPQFEER